MSNLFCFVFSATKQNDLTDSGLFFLIFNFVQTVLTDAVSTLSLVNPCRSTLNDNRISPLVSPTLEDVIADLRELHWEECSTVSVQTLSSVSSSLVMSSSATPTPDPNHQHYADCSNGRKKSKRKALYEIENGGLFSPPKLGRPKKEIPKRKRSIKAINGGSGVHGNALALDFFPIGTR